MSADDYMTVSRKFARDSRISLKARGLGLWLFSHQDGWNLSVRSIAKQVGAGVEAVQSGLKELEEHGYLTRVQSNEAGRFGDMDYLVTDVPAGDTASGKPVHGGDPDAETPADGSTADRVPDTHKETTPKETNTQGDQPEEKTSDTDALFELEGADENGEYDDVEPGPSFDDFWAVYPVRKAKQAARNAWDKALLRVPRADRADRARAIVKGAEEYRDDPGRKPTFTKHPATWLNGGCWEDDPTPVGSGNPRGGYQQYRDEDLYPGSKPWFNPDDLQD